MFTGHCALEADSLMPVDLTSQPVATGLTGLVFKPADSLKLAPTLTPVGFVVLQVPVVLVVHVALVCSLMA